jgi:hypothetical protein
MRNPGNYIPFAFLPNSIIMLNGPARKLSVQFLLALVHNKTKSDLLSFIANSPPFVYSAHSALPRACDRLPKTTASRITTMALAPHLI